MRTLVIDSTWRPVNFVNDVRAISMLLLGKVELISKWEGEEFRTTNASFEIPAIVKLNRYVSKNNNAPRFRRKLLYCRDKFQCQYCGKTLAGRSLTIDHVVPRCKGGKTNWSNCVVACFSCNEKKGDKSLEQSGLTLRSMPTEPKPFHYWHAFDYAVCNKWHPTWEDFIGTAS